MKSLYSAFKLAILLLVGLAACAPGSTPASTPSPELANLAGPEMKLGSTWLYADGSLLVAVPAGIFTMGGDKPDNAPHPINLPEYWIFRTKVTNAQYAYCVGLGECTPPFAHDNPGFSDYLHANDPVVGVDYSQAAAYCAFAHARLPTEAEWEKAARGPDAAIYPWGDAAPACDLLNFDVCVGGTTPVDQYAAGQSYYHAFDMEGNAFEWAADWYEKDYYLSSPPDNPQGPEKGRSRVVRSSAFNSGGNQTQTFNRFFSGPADHRDNLGFRCVVEDPDYFAPFCQYPPIYGTDGVGGAPSGNPIQVSCPDMALIQYPYCSGGQPYTVVWVRPPTKQPYTLDMPRPACNPLSPGIPYDTHYGCKAGGQISLCSFCTVTITLPPQCPQGYTYDAASKTCIGQGTPGACLPGSTPDPTGQCCTYEPGSPAPTANPLSSPIAVSTSAVVSPPIWHGPNCPPGTWHYSPTPYQNLCVRVAVQDLYCKSEAIVLHACGGGGGGGGGSTCNITEASCAATCNPLGYIYDAAACSCTCNAG